MISIVLVVNVTDSNSKEWITWWGTYRGDPVTPIDQYPFAFVDGIQIECIVVSDWFLQQQRTRKQTVLRKMILSKVHQSSCNLPEIVTVYRGSSITFNEDPNETWDLIGTIFLDNHFQCIVTHHWNVIIIPTIKWNHSSHFNSFTDGQILLKTSHNQTQSYKLSFLWFISFQRVKERSTVAAVVWNVWRITNALIIDTLAITRTVARTDPWKFQWRKLWILIVSISFISFISNIRSGFKGETNSTRESQRERERIEQN